jgi:hypothetical protein
MSAASHISWDELSEENRALLERTAESGVIFIDGKGRNFKISALPGHTAAETLSRLEHLPAVDDEWASDLEAIIRENRAHDRDPWA